MQHLWVAVVLSGLSLLMAHLFRSRQWKSRLPPGPKGYPIIGNLLDMPTSQEWIHFAKWSETWGDLTSATVAGATIVNIHTFAKAAELLEDKSSIYSDRPILPMFGELIGWKASVSIMRYGPTHRESRKMIHQELGTEPSIQRFYSYQDVMSFKFLQELLKSPQNFYKATDHHISSIMLRIAYGYIPDDNDDPILRLNAKAMEQVAPASNPANFLINVLPFLRHVPSWFPGAHFRRQAALWRQDFLRMVNTPFDMVLKEFAEGTAADSFVLRWLRQDITSEQSTLLKHAATDLLVGEEFLAFLFCFGKMNFDEIILSAGSETTTSILHLFFFIMTISPEIQRNAQAEIDAVVGTERLPALSDRENLPYIEALIKELLRYQPPLPYGVPHCATVDDIHDGYLIPKGATLLANLWQMSRDPKVYTDPESFNPSRFLGPNPEQDPSEWVFGFGRRVCPGMKLAYMFMFITIARTLATFKIAPANGKDLPTFVALEGILNHIQEFECSVLPRDPDLKLDNLVD